MKNNNKLYYRYIFDFIDSFIYNFGSLLVLKNIGRTKKRYSFFLFLNTNSNFKILEFKIIWFWFDLI